MPTIKPDEPVFLLRAQDKLAPATLEFWADALEKAGGDQTTSQHVRAWAELMRVWQKDHGCKVPDASPHVHTPVSG